MTGASRCSTVADLEGAAPAGPGASRSRAHGWWERFALLRRRHSSGVCAPMKWAARLSSPWQEARARISDRQSRRRYFYRRSAISRSAAHWRNVGDTSVTVVTSNNKQPS